MTALAVISSGQERQHMLILKWVSLACFDVRACCATTLQLSRFPKLNPKPEHTKNTTERNKPHLKHPHFLQLADYKPLGGHALALTITRWMAVPWLCKHGMAKHIF